jgi:tetratricopeptide (TPR) repeat protein
MKHGPVLLLALALCACARLPLAENARTDLLFHDELFAAPSQRIDAGDVFAASEEMKHYLNVEIAEHLRAKGRQRGLYDALYSTKQLKLEYDAALTRNASQAFAARSGNCLSLVIMTAALAKELGMSIRYQRLFTEEAWSRSGGIYFSNGHVNVTLGRRATDPRMRLDEHNLLTIDFLPVNENRVQHAWEIREETIVAMYMNNRAAETLARGQLDDAYWWAREAVVQDPKFLNSYNTLGVIYRHHGNLKEAEQVLGYVLEREPANAHVMSNLVVVYNDEGRVAESAALARKLEKMQPYPPYYFFDRGVVAMRERNFEAAKELFIRELDRDAYNHEFHFWLAAAYVGLGQIRDARAHLLLALENSTTRKEHEIYAAKLDLIRANPPR